MPTSIGHVRLAMVVVHLLVHARIYFTMLLYALRQESQVSPHFAFYSKGLSLPLVLLILLYHALLLSLPKAKITATTNINNTIIAITLYHTLS